MKVVLLNDRWTGGGTENQVHLEVRLLAERGHDVWAITLDPDSRPDAEVHHLNIEVPTLRGPRRWSRQLLGSRPIAMQLEGLLREIAPDVVHLNNAVESPHDVYQALRHYPTVQTIRDYGAICPLGVCIDDHKVECEGYKVAACSRCRPAGLTALKHLKLERVNRMRTSAVDVLVAPSFRMIEKCAENGLKVHHLRDCVDPHKIFKGEHPRTFGSFLYCGGISRAKGVDVLIRVFDRFAELSNCQLNLAGPVDDDMRQAIASHSGLPWFNYLGQLDAVAIARQLSQTYCVVAPSVGLDNYPNVVLEAMANGAIVVGSNRGGLPEMIQQPSQLFDILDDDSIQRCLEEVLGLAPDAYAAITDAALRRVLEQNAPDCYYNDLIDIFARAIALHRSAC